MAEDRKMRSFDILESFVYGNTLRFHLQTHHFPSTGLLEGVTQEGVCLQFELDRRENKKTRPQMEVQITFLLESWRHVAHGLHSLFDDFLGECC